MDLREPTNSKTCTEAVTSFLSLSAESIRSRLGKNKAPRGIEEVKGGDLILVNRELRASVERKRTFYEKAFSRKEQDPTNERLDRISNKAKADLHEVKHKLGKGIVNSTLLDSSVSSNSVIVIRAINGGANSYIGHKAVLKPTYIKAKTAKYGLIKGLIPVDQNLVARDLPARSLRKYQSYIEAAFATGLVHKEVYETAEGKAVVRDGVQVVTDEIRPGDKPIEILIDANGDKFTADIDLFSIGGKTPDTERATDMEELGTTTSREIGLIKKINQIFSKYDTHRPMERDLVLHGSEVHNPKPVKMEFPLRAYTPDGRVFNIKEGPEEDPEKHLNAFRSWVQSKGYFLP